MVVLKSFRTLGFRAGSMQITVVRFFMKFKGFVDCEKLVLLDWNFIQTSFIKTKVRNKSPNVKSHSKHLNNFSNICFLMTIISTWIRQSYSLNGFSLASLAFFLVFLR